MVSKPLGLPGSVAPPTEALECFVPPLVIPPFPRGRGSLAGLGGSKGFGKRGSVRPRGGRRVLRLPGSQKPGQVQAVPSLWGRAELPVPRPAVALCQQH
jgi:hypothetical protein